MAAFHNINPLTQLYVVGLITSQIVNDYIFKYIELPKFVNVQISKSMEDECFQRYKLNAKRNNNISKGRKNNILSMWKWVYQGHVYKQGLDILL